MKIVLHADADIELVDLEGAGFEVEAHDPALYLSAFELFAAGLGLCTGSVMLAYGQTLGVDTSGLAVRLRWDFDEKLRRITRIQMDLRWPALPPERIEAARRAAASCPIHKTLHHPVEIVTEVAR